MFNKIIIVWCCLFVIKMVQFIIGCAFDAIRKHILKNLENAKDNKKMSNNNIDKEKDRQYKVLSGLKQYQESRIDASGYKKLDNVILNQDFYKSIHKELDLEKFEVNTILKELHDCGYVYDVASVESHFTDVHTCKISDKGLDYLKNYQEEIKQTEKEESILKDPEIKKNLISLVIDFFKMIFSISTKIIGIYIIISIIEK